MSGVVIGNIRGRGFVTCFTIFNMLTSWVFSYIVTIRIELQNKIWEYYEQPLIKQFWEWSLQEWS
jgi:hypothetical protein